MHDGALRVGVFDASESYGHARRARRVGYIAVIGSEGRSSSVGTVFHRMLRRWVGPVGGGSRKCHQWMMLVVYRLSFGYRMLKQSSKQHDSTLIHTYVSIHSHLVNTGVPGDRYIDIASVSRRADRVLTITYLGWYHMVLRHPPDRRTGIVYRVGNVKTVTRSVLGPGGAGSVISTSRPYYVERAGS